MIAAHPGLFALVKSHAVVAPSATSAPMMVTDSGARRFAFSSPLFVPARSGNTVARPPHEGGRLFDMTYPAMTSPSPTRWKRALHSVLRFARVEPPASDEHEERRTLAVRTLCLAIVQDLPDDPRVPLEYRVLRARHLGDLWDLRSNLFGAISLAFGEHVARERLQRLDAHWH